MKRFLHIQRVSLIMNKSAGFHPALILVFWAKFLPVRLFRPVRLFIFCQNSTLYAYSESTLIRETRVVHYVYYLVLYPKNELNYWFFVCILHILWKYPWDIFKSPPCISYIFRISYKFQLWGTTTAFDGNYTDSHKHESTLLHTDSTKINCPMHNIHMYWTNFWQPTDHVNKIFLKNSYRSWKLTSHLYLIFGTFCVQIGKFLKSQWVFEKYLKRVKSPFQRNKTEKKFSPRPRGNSLIGKILFEYRTRAIRPPSWIDRLLE